MSENPLFKSVLDAFYEGEMDNKVAKMFGVEIVRGNWNAKHAIERKGFNLNG